MKRMKNNTTLKETNITDLQDELTINILTCLPIQFIHTCSLVCTNWATLIAQPYFIGSYESRGRAPPIHFLINDRSGPNNLSLAEIDQASCTTTSPTYSLNQSRFSLDFLYKIYPDPSSYALRVFSTCALTGCIAAYEYRTNRCLPSSAAHIFNPKTGQHIMVEKTARGRDSGWHRCALVFAHKSNKLKLLQFFPRERQDGLHVVSVDIQTVGATSRRHVGIIPFHPRNPAFPTCAGGLYFWLDTIEYVVYSFNAEEMVFEQIQTPPCFQDSDEAGLGLLNGSLCIYIKSRELEFWVMSVDGSWTKKLVIDNIKIRASKILQPLKLLENGEIVLLYRNYKAICYNPSTGYCKSIRYATKDFPRYWYRPVPYIPSLKRVLPT